MIMQFDMPKQPSRLSKDTDNKKLNRSPIGYLLFKKVKIEGANAISSPLTYGFPAITGFLGSFHAMSRKMANVKDLSNVSLGGVLIACHECITHTYQDKPYNNYTFNQTRNPIKKDGKTASIIEEGKCRIVVSLVVEVFADSRLDDTTIDLLSKQSKQWIWQQRIAGGSVQGIDRFNPVHYVDHEDIDSIIPHLLPAFVLMDAQTEFDEIIEEVHQKNPDATPLDVLIDVCTLHHTPEISANGETKWLTTSLKTNRGWLVPMPIGYQGISEVFEPGVMQNVRNPEYPSQYVEAIYSLGKWVYPQRLGGATSEYDLVNAFWRYHHDADHNLYLVTQNTDL